MGLTQEDRKEIVDIIRSTMQSGCVCGISHDTQQEVGHFFGRLRDLGKGNLNEGIEIFSRAIEAMAKYRKFGEKIGGAVATAVAVSIALGGLAFIGSSIVTWVRKG
jgi:hypothetical protein